MKISSSLYSPSMLRRILASGAIGNIIETYDMILITLLAGFISTSFMPPAKTQLAGIVHVLYVFLIGMLVRPMGTLIMGFISDYIGRKRVMIISIIMTGLSTFCMGFLPTYQSVGILSTVLFIALRITQSFFTGIEYINSTSYLIENSHRSSKGYYASWAAIGISGGYLIGTIVVYMLNLLITHNEAPNYIWRLAFLFSVFGIIYGYWLRLNIPESFEYIMSEVSGGKTKKIIICEVVSFIRKNISKLLGIFGLTALGCALTYIYYIFIPINLTLGAHFSRAQALTLNMISLMLVVIMIPVFGKISDFISKKTLLQWVCFSIICLSYPLSEACYHGGGLNLLYLLLLTSIPSACFFSLYPRIVTEIFPINIRCTAASFIYQLAVTSMMSVVPLLEIKFSENYGSITSLSVLLIVSAIITWASLYFIGLSSSNLDKKAFEIVA